MIKNSGSEQQDPGRAKDKTIEEIVSASNPLPPEIEQMPEEETCCKFCGVSYLIHREVTRLKSLLQNFEKFHESYLVRIYHEIWALYHFKCLLKGLLQRGQAEANEAVGGSAIHVSPITD
jgi:hypothetical protein